MSKIFKWGLFMIILIILFGYNKIASTVEEFDISKTYGETEQNIKLFFDKDYVLSIKEKLKLDYIDKESISKAINKEITENTKTLFKGNTITTELNYFIRDNEILFDTDAKYYNSKLQCAGKYLDFDIATVANFGLRGYLIKTNSDGNCSIIEKGSYNTAYYSVSYDKRNNYLAYAIPGHKKIEIYNKDTMKLVWSIDGYYVTSLEFYKGDLFFAGYKEADGWQKASIYQYSLVEDKIINEYFKEEIADCRGISFNNDLMAVSNGIHNKVHIYDMKKNKVLRVIKGLNWPNGNYLVDDSLILIADKHNNYLRKINYKNMTEEWHSPTFQLKSPGGIYLIEKGNFKGYYLISDTDNNRVILVEPKKWEIVYEIQGVRSVLKAIPIYKQGIY